MFSKELQAKPESCLNPVDKSSAAFPPSPLQMASLRGGFPLVGSCVCKVKVPAEAGEHRDLGSQCRSQHRVPPPALPGGDPTRSMTTGALPRGRSPQGARSISVNVQPCPFPTIPRSCPRPDCCPPPAMGLSVWPVPFGLAYATRPAPPNAIASAKVCCRGPVPPPAGKNSWGGVDPSSPVTGTQAPAPRSRGLGPGCQK